jgi:hypothetical protein
MNEFPQLLYSYEVPEKPLLLSSRETLQELGWECVPNVYKDVVLLDATMWNLNLS